MEFEDGPAGFLEGEVVCEMLELSSYWLRILQSGVSKPWLVYTHTQTRTLCGSITYVYTYYICIIHIYNMYNIVYFIKSVRPKQTVRNSTRQTVKTEEMIKRGY